MLYKYIFLLCIHLENARHTYVNIVLKVQNYNAFASCAKKTLDFGKQNLSIHLCEIWLWTKRCQPGTVVQIWLIMHFTAKQQCWIEHKLKVIRHYACGNMSLSGFLPCIIAQVYCQCLVKRQVLTQCAVAAHIYIEQAYEYISACTQHTHTHKLIRADTNPPFLTITKIKQNAGRWRSI